MIKIYTTEICPYCINAKLLLENLGLAFEEIKLNSQKEKEELYQKTGMYTVPQIFIKEELIGGFDELNQMVTNGELAKKLKG